jgi:hypothetical protein
MGRGQDKIGLLLAIREEDNENAIPSFLTQSV